MEYSGSGSGGEAAARPAPPSLAGTEGGAAFPAKGTQFVLAAVTGEVFYNPKSKGSHLMLDTDYEEKMQRAMVKKDVSKQTVHQNTLAFDREERDRREKSKKNVFGGASSSKQFML